MYHLVTGLYAEWTKKARYNVLIVGLSGVGKSCILEKVKSLYLKRPALPPSKIAPTVGQNVFDLSLSKLDLHFWDLGGSPSVRTLWFKYYEETNAVVWVVDARDFVHFSSTGSTGKGKAVSSDEDSEAAKRREESWNILSDLVTHPSLEGRPILVLANKGDECSLDSTSLQADERKALTQNVRSWLELKLASMGQNMPTETTQKPERLPNVFADTDDAGDLGSSQLRRTPRALAGAGDYEWEVITTSAIDGTGLHEAVDWLSIRVQSSVQRR